MTSKEYSKNYYQKNRERLLQEAKERAKRNLPRRRETMKNWQKNNPEKLRNTRFRERWGRYGLTMEMVEMIREKQNFKCAICTKPLGPWGRDTCVDHDHKTNEVRGLLCLVCNSGLGKFRDSIPLLEQGIQYLRTPPVRIPLVGFQERDG